MKLKMAFYAAFLPALGISSRASDAETKTISYRGGIVTFEVPRNWKEVYSETDGAEFFEDKPDSPTFRLRLLTFRAPPNSPEESAEGLLNSLKEVKGKAEPLSNGNALFAYEERAEDRGEKLVIYYWLLANVVRPDHGRIANFSFTVLSRESASPETKNMISNLDRDIRRAVFSSIIGKTSP